MRATNYAGMTAQTQSVVAGTVQLVTIRPWRMHIMATGTGHKFAAVAVHARLDEIGVLLVVRF